MSGGRESTYDHSQSPEPRARRIRLSRNRALVGDVVHFASRIPRFAVDRLMSVSEVGELRDRAAPRISWSALFLKAYSLVAADCRSLRQAYLAWPWGHLIEMPHSVGMVAINRRDEERDEDRLCWGRFIRPEQQSLVELQQALDGYQREPIGEIFRRQVLHSKLPIALRRLVWWINLNLVVKSRARRVGTFSMSSLAGQGAWNRSHPAIHTTSLTFGPLDEQERMLVTLICDHRVLDGALAARALADLETALRGPIAAELAKLGKSREAA
jgi:2-oxoacid dehydrogenases acyltransferase (catalytic domain)